MIDRLVYFMLHMRTAYCITLHWWWIGSIPLICVKVAFRNFDDREPGARQRALADVDQRTRRI